jgi:hypothetical protein
MLELIRLVTLAVSIVALPAHTAALSFTISAKSACFAGSAAVRACSESNVGWTTAQAFAT